VTPSAVPLPAGFKPYEWTPAYPPETLRFDQNVPPLPGVPQVPIAESFARLNEYPEGSYRALREAAAGYTGVLPEQIVVGAGADDVILLIARAFLAPGQQAVVTEPTYSLYRIATELAGAEVSDDEGAVVWVCNPNNPTGELTPPDEVAAFARSRPDALVVVDEAYIEFAPAGASVVPLLEPNMVVVRTLSKAFGLASLRVGYAVAPVAVAAELEARRPPAPISGPSARIATAALREPRLDVEQTIAERERVRAALLAAGFDCPESRGNFLFVRAPFEADGIVVRHFDDGFRMTVRLPAENDRLLAALGVETEPSPRRTALVIRTTTETSLRISLDLDGQGRARVATGIGLLDHLLGAFAFHGGLDLDLLASGDLEVDEHHTTEDILAALGDALALALGDRAGITRYGSADVPMDEALARATIDLVQRPHAEVSLAPAGTVLPHAFERFAMQAKLTLHLEATGVDEHHVAEAAFKALGRALRLAVEPGVSGSTKGAM
jgi:histidinol-phosphate aminotransferase